MLKRDKNKCCDCGRSQGEVDIDIHHEHPYEFDSIYQKNGFEGTLRWHSDPNNWKYLVTLCKPCHIERHKRDEESEEAA